MSNKQFIYSSAIIVLGFFQTAPAFLMLSSKNIAIIVLGIFWSILLAYIWSSTIIGRWFFKELYICTLRLEKFMFGSNAGC